MLFYSNLFTGKCIIYPLFIRLLLLPKKRKRLNTACLKPVPIVNPFLQRSLIVSVPDIFFFGMHITPCGWFRR